MMKKTHLSIGLACSLPFLISGTVLPYSVIGILGSIAPDWDFKLHLKHRTITHSITLLLLSTILIYKVNVDICYIWFLNYLLHLIADSLTKKGTPFLYPFKKKYYGLKLFKTGSFTDYLFFLVSIYFLYYQITHTITY